MENATAIKALLRGGSTSATASLVLLTVLWLLLLYRLRRRVARHEKLRMPPGPAGWPLIGSLPAVLRSKPRFRWLLNQAEGKDIIGVKVGQVYMVVVNDPALAREFLRRHDAAFSSRSTTIGPEYCSRKWLSAAVTPMGDQWKKMRRIVTSEVVSSASLRWQASLRMEEANNLVRYLRHLCKSSGGGAVIDVRRACRYYCGCVIRRMLLGVRHFGAGASDGGPGPGPEELEHIEAAFTVDKHLYVFCISDFLPWLRFLDLDGHERKLKGAMKVVNKLHDPIIDERLKKRRGTAAGGQPEDILDVMISLKDAAGKQLLESEEMKAQIQELIFATIDNPSNIGEWTMAELLNQPDLLQKAIDELDRVVGQDRLVQESDFPSLPYIKACTRETLRLHPVGPFNMPHVALHDMKVAGYFIPEGTHVLLSRVGLNRNPNVWEDPLRFNPERHLKEGKVELAEPDLRFISFTAGRRGCVGAPLGTLMTYMLVARLIQACSWSMPQGESAVDLSEEHNGFFKAKPLQAYAKPRLSIVEDAI